MSVAEIDLSTDETGDIPVHRPVAPSADFAPGIEIPGYALLSELGVGGMGVVYCARQLALDRVVALKTVHGKRQSSGVALARFVREAKAVASLRHPNIVTAYDSGEYAGTAYYTMELLDGSGLDVRLRGGRRLDERLAWQVVRQAAAGLAEAESQGIFHRDVKPGNIFLTPVPTGYPLPVGIPLVKVTDFGLACFRDAASQDEETKLTQNGAIVGTPVYMAPEQFRRDAIDGRADIYSLGITAYEMLVGEAPFCGLGIWEIVEAKRGDEWMNAPDLPPDSLALIRDMTRADRNARIGSYGELTRRIDAVLGRIDGDPRFALALDRPRRRILRAACWAFAAAAVLISVLVLLGRGRDTRMNYPEGYGPKPAGVEYLFGPTAGKRWEASVGRWADVDDPEDGTRNLKGRGTLRWPLREPGDLRLNVEFDFDRAEAVELHFAIDPATDRRLVLRVTKAEGACVGRRTGDGGAFRPISNWTKIDWNAGERVKCLGLERIAGGWFPSVNGRRLDGWRDDGVPKLSEFRLLAEGGDVRLSQIDVTELVREGK